MRKKEHGWLPLNMKLDSRLVSRLKQESEAKDRGMTEIMERILKKRYRLK